ncbi:MAG: single-stranded DNA-binding protein [Saprospiraceae bacterium]|nr:single-stranded DNA-binding protein [Bacteroidia bacterium]NNE13551.1 single-stranded DNA-binding protein [Saprospiraceae bacterium]NNL93073.1 single-stranded DNA-binding protein [Saprospiraceae bacterium]
MSSVRNSVQLIGHLGKDVEVKTFDTGKSKSSFSLATNEYYKNNKGEKETQTQWHNVIAWGKVAENMNSMLAKGSEVLINGKLTTRSYTDKEGKEKWITEVVASDFMVFGKKAAPF